MDVLGCAIDGVWEVRATTVEDDRGFFRETVRHSVLEAAVGRPVRFRQNNHSRSRAGVLRGFHAEPWDKLVYVPRGVALCVVADIRPQSPTFATTVQFELGDIAGGARRLFIANGLANAFLAMTDTDYTNDVSAEFEPQGRGGVVWNDPHLGVAWPTRDPIVSAFDRGLPTLAHLFADHPRLRRTADVSARSHAVARQEVDER